MYFPNPKLVPFPIFPINRDLWTCSNAPRTTANSKSKIRSQETSFSVRCACALSYYCVLCSPHPIRPKGLTGQALALSHAGRGDGLGVSTLTPVCYNSLMPSLWQRGGEWMKVILGTLLLALRCGLVLILTLSSRSRFAM